MRYEYRELTPSELASVVVPLGFRAVARRIVGESDWFVHWVRS